MNISACTQLESIRILSELISSSGCNATTVRGKQHIFKKREGRITDECIDITD